MIIIFNWSGLLIGFAGCVMGLIVGVLTGSLAVGLLGLSATWIGLGLTWRNSRGKGEPKRPFPSLFFIPLPFLAIVTVILALLAIPVDLKSKDKVNDPRAQSLGWAESSLRSANASGDVDLSTAVHQVISSKAHSGAIPSSLSVYTDATDSAVLVLVKVGNLKEFSEDARRSLLSTVDTAVKAFSTHQSKQLYVGIKGTALYGAIQTPSQTITKTTPNTPLLDYYTGAAPAANPSPFPPVPSDPK